METDLAKRADIFRQAERILIAEDPPIVPLYFYAGFNCFDPRKIEGIWQNILYEHPMQYLGKKKVSSIQSSVFSPDSRSADHRVLNTEY